MYQHPEASAEAPTGLNTTVVKERCGFNGKSVAKWQPYYLSKSQKGFILPPFSLDSSFVFLNQHFPYKEVRQTHGFIFI